jgi:hypothetical protein
MEKINHHNHLYDMELGDITAAEIAKKINEIISVVNLLSFMNNTEHKSIKKIKE